MKCEYDICERCKNPEHRVLFRMHNRVSVCDACRTAIYKRSKLFGIPTVEYINRLVAGDEPAGGLLTSKEVRRENEILITTLREIARGDEHHYGYERAKYLAMQTLKEIEDARKNKDKDASGVQEEKGLHAA